jgi:cytochrome c oxidase subunit 2
MTGLIILLCIVLLTIVLIQIGKVTELSAKIRGEKEAQKESNEWNSKGFLIFGVIFLIFCVVSALIYKDDMLWYGVQKSASEKGGVIDRIFNITLIVTGIVFFITHILLFWFSYKYRGREGRKVLYMPHDNRLEMIWTAIPAIVMTFLVISGLDAWNDVMSDVKEGEDHIEIEANGMQFAWNLRYPGPDGKLGTKDYKRITGTNPFGQDFTDSKGHDDFYPDEIVLPVGKKVRVRITARDVLHNFYLPHFRVKMDAIPGLPTYFVFTPTITTEEYRQMLSKSPEWNEKYDPKDPDSKTRWEMFDYELACAELCGKGHYSMRRKVRIVSQEEYDAWSRKQQSWYMNNVHNKGGKVILNGKEENEDPFEGKVIDSEAIAGAAALKASIEKAIKDSAAVNTTLKLDYVNFETGSATLTTSSKYQLDVLAEEFAAHPSLTTEVSGHTDNVGDAKANLALSQSRAAAVKTYLLGKGVADNRLRAVGFGSSKPIDAADTAEARAKNRRTEFRILTK